MRPMTDTQPEIQPDAPDPSIGPASEPEVPVDPYAHVPEPTGQVPDKAQRQSRVLSDELVWEDPGVNPNGGPQTVSRRGIWIERLTPLMERPNVWARLRVFDGARNADKAAANLKAGKTAIPEVPEGAQFVFTSRSNKPEPGQSSLYGMFRTAGTGNDPSPPATPEAQAAAAQDPAGVVSAANPVEPELVPTGQNSFSNDQTDLDF